MFEVSQILHLTEFFFDRVRIRWSVNKIFNFREVCRIPLFFNGYQWWRQKNVQSIKRAFWETLLPFRIYFSLIWNLNKSFYSLPEDINLHEKIVREIVNLVRNEYMNYREDSISKRKNESYTQKADLCSEPGADTWIKSQGSQAGIPSPNPKNLGFGSIL